MVKVLKAAVYQKQATATELPSPAPTPTTSLITETPHRPANTVRFIASRYTTAAGEAPVAEPVPVQSKELTMTSKLQALDKEATVRFTVDMSETLHCQKGENENE